MSIQVLEDQELIRMRMLILHLLLFFSINPGAAASVLLDCFPFSRPEYFSPFPGDKIFSCFGLSNSER
jgi:hypothetical protein